MTSALDQYIRVADAFELRLRGVAADQWAKEVPSCPGWTVRELVTHVIDTHHHVLASIGEQHAAPSADADLEDVWTAARSAVTVALTDDAVAGHAVPSPAGHVTFADVASGLLSNDTIYHVWDLARATDQDESLDPEACEIALAAMRPMDAVIRQPGLFGPKLDAPADADPQTKLLAFGGRQV